MLDEVVDHGGIANQAAQPRAKSRLQRSMQAFERLLVAIDVGLHPAVELAAGRMSGSGGRAGVEGVGVEVGHGAPPFRGTGLR